MQQDRSTLICSGFVLSELLTGHIFVHVFTINLRLTGVKKLISYTFPVLLSSHISSQHFLWNCARYFGIALWGCSNFGQKDTFLIIVCPYWKFPLEARAIKWSCQNTLKQPYPWIMFIFPLVHPCITRSGVFPLLHPVAVKVPTFFCQPPCCLHDCRWWNLTAHGFFSVSWWWLSARLLHHFFPSFQHLWKGPGFSTLLPLLLLSQNTQYWRLFLSDSSNSQLLTLHP